MDAIDRVAGLPEDSSVTIRRFLTVALIAATSCTVLAQTAQPSPSTLKARKLRISPGVAEGLLIKKVPPHYPPEAKEKRITGIVILEFTVDRSGNVQGLKVLSGDPILARAAAEAVQQWKYRPYLLNGEPVEIETTAKFTFRL
jgi:protein TonB